MLSRIRINASTGIICSAIVASFFISSPSLWEPASVILNNQVAPAIGLPARLIIPTIKVNAVIEQVGLTATGLMDAPKGPSTVGWYELGPRPGETGSAVIDGHSGWKDNVSAVFDDLSALRKGDKLYVEDTRGVRTTFVIREIKTYDARANTSEVFLSSDGKAHLNLITCEGVWDAVSKSSPKRLVIFSDEEG